MLSDIYIYWAMRIENAKVALPSLCYCSFVSIVILIVVILIIMRIGGRYLTILLLVFLLHLQCMRINSSEVGDSNIKCIKTEREALLKLKQGIIDDYSYLSSWVGGEEEEQQQQQSDCCKWSRIQCNNQTGHVVYLDLHSARDMPLKGQINPSLLELRYLTYLDMSRTSFELSDEVPELIGSLSELRYLNLSRAGLVGKTFPYKIGNLSSLRALDLSFNYGLEVESLVWLSHLSSLNYFDFSNNILRNASSWLPEINMLPSLIELKLAGCFLVNPIPPFPSYINFSTSLSTLDLSFSSLSTSIFTWLSNCTGLVDLNLKLSSLQGPIPDAFWNMTSLRHLDLSMNKLEGGIPKSMGNLCNLQSLDLSVNSIKTLIGDLTQNLFARCSPDSLEVLSLRLNQISGMLPDFTRFTSLRELRLDKNQIVGSIPKSFGNLAKLLFVDLTENQLTGSLPDLTKSLRVLMLSFNQLNGTLTNTIEQLSNLVYLYLSSNHFEGIISETHLSNLPRLQYLDLSSNPLILNLSADWVPPFRLVTLRLSSCKLGPEFPKWIQKHENLNHLDISNSSISETIPNWFSEFSPNLEYLNLSHNELHGMLPNASVKLVKILDLSYNHFEGPLPLFFSDATVLDLSHNMFSGGISSICTSTSNYLSHLDLSDNLLSGGIPDCFNGNLMFSVLLLANNNLSGEIPTSIGSLHWLQTLHLQNNSLSGVLPSLKNCVMLKLLNIGENRLSGNLPAWLGESFLSLLILSLRSNAFYGSIPLQLCHLTSIQILDLSDNNISGNIPRCFNNLSAMAQTENSGEPISYSYLPAYYIENKGYVSSFTDTALVTWKGRRDKYEKSLALLRIIDLSTNNLSGEIPEEMMSLSGLVALNLSRNHLVNNIPERIGYLKQLESLDFSRNRLSGRIPASMSGLSFLQYLDLSNNDLFGKIPSGTQLQSFNASYYSENPKLCGPPLTKKCLEDETPAEGDDEQEDDDWLGIQWNYVTAGIGFFVGFWGVCFTLVFKSTWRHAYFRSWDHFVNRLYVMVAVNKAKLLQKIQS